MDYQLTQLNMTFTLMDFYMENWTSGEMNPRTTAHELDRIEDESINEIACRNNKH